MTMLIIFSCTLLVFVPMQHFLNIIYLVIINKLKFLTQWQKTKLRIIKVIKVMTNEWYRMISMLEEW